MTKRMRLLAVAAITVVTAVAAGSAAMAHGGDDSRGGGVFFLRERLSGLAENPSLSTTGTGSFRAQVNERTQEITYTLTYAGLEGAVAQSHIHFGNAWQNAGISVFLCTNLGNGPAGTQACPEAPATITGTLRPADVIGPVGQGITAGQFEELLAAIRAGATYVNVHSALYPAGEIRAQLEHHH
jgi:hypothetical protein